MNSLHLIRKNLTRKKTRTLFTGLSIVVAFLLFGLLGALGHAFSLGVSLAGADRLITIHKVTLIELLPISYGDRIRQIDGVEEVSHYTWFAGYYQEPNRQIASFPTDPDTFKRVYSEFEVAPEQWEAWRANRSGMLAGRALAQSYGWEVGQRIPIGSTIWPKTDGGYSWEFTLDAVYDGVGNGSDEQQFYFHYEYFNEARAFGQDLVGWYVLKIADPDRSDEIAKEVDALFANSPRETKTSTEKGFVQAFAGQMGDIGAIVNYILVAVFFTLLLVAGNTMAQSVRERTSELGVMKTVGFSDRRILWMVLAESLLLSVIAGGIGLALAVGFVNGLQSVVARFLPGLIITPQVLAVGVLLVLALGIVSGLVPALRAMRLDVVKALARR